MRPSAVLWWTPLLLFWLSLCSPARAVNSACSDTKSDAGSGSISEIQWSYNKAIDTCESFLYHGNGKSTNIFTTEQKCMAECSHKYQELYPAGAGVCSLSVEKGPCMALLVMWYYDSVNKKCDTFFYGGCRGNGNRFENRHNCTSTCSTSKQGKSGSASAVEEDEPAPSSSNEGTIVAIVFSVIFAVAFIITLTMFIRQRKAMKQQEQKPKFVAVEMQ